MKKEIKVFLSLCVAMVIAIIFGFAFLYQSIAKEINDNISANTEGKKYIKWVNFNIPYSAMEKALNADIKSYNTDNKISWIEILSYLGAKYGGDFKKYKSRDMDQLIKKLKSGENIEDIVSDKKNYNYFLEAYTAVLGGMVGEFEIENSEGKMQKKYGLKAYSPIGYGYSFNHYDDFGNERSFGFKRKHLGNDLLGKVGTPIIAVESGYVESIGWNRYGGWRLGIRSIDKKRSYYYAHLRKDNPYAESIKEGDLVMAGDVIGYLGMTGYSDNENVNGMTKPHLHFGVQLIFDESQKEGNNEIWIDVYNIVKLLQKHKSPVIKDKESGHYKRKYNFIDLQAQ